MPTLQDYYKSNNAFDQSLADLKKPPKLAPTGTAYGTPERRREVFGDNPAYGADYDPGKFYELYGRSASPTEDKLGQSGLMSLIANRGYSPGERERLNAMMSREIGARSTLESQLLNERGASIPGGGSSGFSDNIYANIAANARQALGQYNLGLEEAGQERRYGAISQLYGSEENERQRRAAEAQAKRNFGYQVAGQLAQGVGEYIGKKSSAAYKKDIKPVYSTIEAKTKIKTPSKRSLLGALKNLDLKTYKYKPGIEPDDDGQEHIGVIAEETPDNLKAGSDKVDLSDILFMTVGALQELSAKVEELQGLGALKPEVALG